MGKGLGESRSLPQENVNFVKGCCKDCRAQFGVFWLTWDRISAMGNTPYNFLYLHFLYFTTCLFCSLSLLVVVFSPLIGFFLQHNIIPVGWSQNSQSDRKLTKFLKSLDNNFFKILSWCSWNLSSLGKPGTKNPAKELNIYSAMSLHNVKWAYTVSLGP